MAMISIRDLTKRFGTLVAVDSLDLDIEEGEVFGLLGPNGAGKTTTISMLNTMRRPTSGSATVNGFDVVTQPAKVRKSIGVVFQEPSVDDLLTGKENLELHGRLYGMDPQLAKRRIKEVLELVELTDRKDDWVRTYSGGMRRRLELARGLMHHPRVLFLDEPTLGLDPQTREHIWKYISKLAREEKITMIVTTHYMEEADALCDRIAIIDHGKIVVSGAPAKLKRLVGGDVVKIRKRGLDACKLSARLKGLGFVKKIECENHELSLTVQDAHENLQKLLAKMGPVDAVEVHEASLNDVFFKYTGRKYREDSAEGGWGERMAQSSVSR